MATLNEQIAARIAAQMAKPITHEVVVEFSDGHLHIHGTRSLSAAQTHVDFVWAKRLNKWLIDRSTGGRSCVVSINIREKK